MHGSPKVQESSLPQFPALKILLSINNILCNQWGWGWGDTGGGW